MNVANNLANLICIQNEFRVWIRDQVGSFDETGSKESHASVPFTPANSVFQKL